MKKSNYTMIKEKLKNGETILLKDILEVLNPEMDTVAIGAGSAWFFMGDLDTFDRDRNYLEEYYSKCYTVWYDKKFKEFCVEKYKEKIIAEKGKLRKEYTIDDIPKDFTEGLEEKFIERLEEKGALTKFTPYLERRVKDFYLKKLQDEPKFAIVLTGVEIGKCWLQHEYPQAIQEIKKMAFKSERFNPLWY